MRFCLRDLFITSLETISFGLLSIGSVCFSKFVLISLVLVGSLCGDLLITLLLTVLVATFAVPALFVPAPVAGVELAGALVFAASDSWLLRLWISRANFSKRGADNERCFLGTLLYVIKHSPSRLI